MKNLFVYILLMWMLPYSVNAEETLDEGLVNPGYHEQPEWFKLSFLDLKEDVAEADQAGKQVLLYFYQDGCPYCKKLLEVNFSLREIAEFTQQKFDVIAINLWGDKDVIDLQGNETTEKEFAKSARVMFTPTLIFLNKDGRPVMRMNGYYPPHKFRAVLDYVAGGYWQKQGFRDYFSALNPLPSTGELYHDDRYLLPPYDLGKRTSKPLLVLFEQRDCSPCDELHGDILQRKESVSLFKQFDVMLLDMWSEEMIRLRNGREMSVVDWARQLDVKYAPSMLFFDRQGLEVFRTEAYLKSFHLQSSMDYVLSGAYKTEPSFQRYIQTRADALEAKGIHVNIMD
ncbi:MAG: thioredoxin fold domain-containing protein [Gammaproteobacteria bacterium]|nr:thioredoxin fold domain-containing protein [Gammaproteobacteria bacterium]